MGFSNFCVLAKTLSVGTNLKIYRLITFLMQTRKNYSLVRIALIVVELFQENNQFWSILGS